VIPSLASPDESQGDRCDLTSSGVLADKRCSVFRRRWKRTNQEISSAPRYNVGALRIQHTTTISALSMHSYCGAGRESTGSTVVPQFSRDHQIHVFTVRVSAVEALQVDAIELDNILLAIARELS